jgi:HK97 gp10 family phage protein
VSNALVGARELGQQLDRLARNVAKRDLRKAMKAGIKPALDRARAIIPQGVRSHRSGKHGRLLQPGFSATQIRVSTSIKANGTDGLAHLGVTKEAYYAVQFTERGTRKESARPWLEPAFEQTAEAQVQAFADSLRASIEESVKG